MVRRRVGWGVRRDVGMPRGHVRRDRTIDQLDRQTKPVGDPDLGDRQGPCQPVQVVEMALSLVEPASRDHNIDREHTTVVQSHRHSHRLLPTRNATQIITFGARRPRPGSGSVHGCISNTGCDDGGSAELCDLASSRERSLRQRQRPAKESVQGYLRSEPQPKTISKQPGDFCEMHAGPSTSPVPWERGESNVSCVCISLQLSLAVPST